MNAAVLGAGKLGAAISLLLARAGHDVTIWARTPEKAQALAAKAPERLHPVESLAQACKDAALVYFAVPAQALREVARAAGAVAQGHQVVLHACRGVGEGFTLASDIIRAETCWKKLGVVGGPLYVDDAERGRPLVCVLAARFDEVQRVTKVLTSGTRVRLHSTRDMTGVEVAGAISNVAQVAAGMALGLGLGETDQGLLLIRGLTEATRLGVALGAERATFSGLAGVGDLIPRPVTSMHHHRKLGAELGAGGDAAALTATWSELEALRTVREARALGARLGLTLPLIEAVDGVLFGGAKAGAVVDRLLGLDLDLDGAA
jgi:glycerol-3-phosphate dehydrogenase (NAD(P)+)